ncbi:MAG: hypothetical protein ABIW82_17770, partial [Dokdonella sp.]
MLHAPALRYRRLIAAFVLVLASVPGFTRDLVFYDGFENACSANRDCSGGLYCSVAGRCAPAGIGVIGSGCSSGANCTSDLACNLYGLGGVCSAAGSADIGQTCFATSNCIAGAVCGITGKCMRTPDAFPPFAGVSCAADEAQFRAYFQVPRPGAGIADFFRLPFPNDARINADGTLDLADFPRPGLSVLGVDMVDRFANTLSADFNGFSALSGITFRFSRKLDINSASAASVRFVDITGPGQAGFGADHARTLHYDAAAHEYLCQNSLAISPDPFDPLRPGGIYAAYLTTELRAVGGGVPMQDPDLIALLGASAPADATLARAWTRYANFRAYLTANSIPTNQIAAVSVITIENAPTKMLALKTAVEAQPPPDISNPVLCDGATTSPCAIAGDPSRACGNSGGSFWEIHGRMTIPNYQQGTLPYAFPADGGQIIFGSDGAPVQNGMLNACFALTVPKSLSTPNGWPLVVHAHGTGGGFRDAVLSGIASKLATAAIPMASLTVEGVGHGERAGASTRPADGLVFNVINPRAAVGNHLQGAVDVIQALRLAQSAQFTFPQTGLVRLDPQHMYFFGHNQGANTGIPAIAVTDLAHAAIFSGAGGSYVMKGVLSRTSPNNQADTLADLLKDAVGETHPAVTLMQNTFDVFDSANYAQMIVLNPPPGVASKHVLLP